MLLEAEKERDNALEKYLQAKQAFQDWRDGYMPYFEDRDYYEERLQRLMDEMDAAEDHYYLARLNYDHILNDRFHGEMYREVNGRPYPQSQSLRQLYDTAVEAKRRYDDLAADRIPFLGTRSELKAELERLRHEWQLALDDYDDKLTEEMLRANDKS